MESTVLGAKQLLRLFDELSKSQKRSVVISGFTKASKPMLQTVKNNLISRTRAKTSGNLAKSLGVKGVRGKSILHLGARTFGNFKGFHSHLVESGTGERYYTTKSGAIHITGRARPMPWFRPGVKSTEKETAERFIDDTIKSLGEMIKRQNAKRKT